MAKQYVIEFGPMDKTVDGKSVAEAIERLVKHNSLLLKRELTDQEASDLRESVVGQAENEKSILIACLESYLAKKHDLSTMTEVSDIVREIRDSVVQVELTTHEIDLIKNGMEGIAEEQMRKMAPAWARYGKLFAQLASPKATE